MRARIGNLDIATKFLSLVTLFTMPIALTIYPTFSKFNFNLQPEVLKALYRSSIRYATLIIVPATIIIAVLAGPGISILFGTRYEFAPMFLSLSLLPFLAVGLGSLARTASVLASSALTSLKASAITIDMATKAAEARNGLL